MPVDNEVYDRLADSWWDDDGFLAMLRCGLNEVRFAYLRDLLRRQGRDPAGLRVLDVGCGGGFLTESLAGLGCAVTGVDPSEKSLEIARRHAETSGLSITYAHGTAEALSQADSAFDLVTCCDVLEHLDDVPAALAEAKRVLAPGGVYFYDTINRTLRSRLVAIWVLQDFPLTRVMPRDVHAWDQFIRPAELARELRRAGLRPHDTAGISPRRNPAVALAALLGNKAGWIDFARLGRAMRFEASGDHSISYMGWASRPAEG